MKVFLRVSVDVYSRQAGQMQEPEQVKEVVQEAIWNALYQAKDQGFDHSLSEQIGLLIDDVEVQDTDLIDQF
jgi:hypothetical protein